MKYRDKREKRREKQGKRGEKREKERKGEKGRANERKRCLGSIIINMHLILKKKN